MKFVRVQKERIGLRIARGDSTINKGSDYRCALHGACLTRKPSPWDHLGSCRIYMYNKLYKCVRRLLRVCS